MSAYSDKVIADGASNYWRLGETSGTTAVDIVGAKNGTISGGVTLAQPGATVDGNTAMLFNGSTGKIVTAASVPIPLICTIELWVKTTDGSVQRPIVTTFFNANTGNTVYAGIGTGGTLYFYSVGGSVGGSSITDGKWHHVCYVLDGATCAFYVDGVWRDTQPQVRTVPSGGPATIANGADNGDFFPGSVDDVAIYPRALTATEIAQHYTLGTVSPIGPRDINTGLYTYLLGVFGLSAATSYVEQVRADGATNHWRLGERDPQTPILDAFNRPNEAQLSGPWVNSSYWGDTSGLALQSHQILQPTLAQAYAGSTWTTPFAGDFEVYLNVDAFPRSAGGDGAVGFSLATIPAPTGAAQIAYEMYLRLSPDQQWHLAFYRPSQTFVDDVPMAFSLGDGVGMARLGTHLLIYRRHNGVWQTVFDVVDPAVVTAPLYVTVFVVEGAPGLAGAGLARLSGFGGGTPIRIAKDAIGGKDGTISGGVSLNQPSAFVDGDSAMRFDGVDDRIALANLTIPALATIEAWVNTSMVGAGQVLSITNPELDVGVGQSNGQKMLCYAGNTTYGVGAITPGWHHLVWVLNGPSVSFYLDGVFDSTAAQPARTGANTGATMLGCVFTAGHSFFNGSLDDVSIYPRALTAAEVAAHYSLGRSGLSGGNDLTTLITRYLATLTGDMTARWKQMEKNAGF